MFIVGVIIAFWVAFAIFQDAKQRYEEGSSAPILWALGVFGIMIIFLPIYFLKRPEKPGEHKERIGKMTKKCLQCAEMIKLEALKCRYCGYEFDKQTVDREIEELKALAKVETESRKSNSKRTWGSILFIFGIIVGLFLLLVLFIGVLTDQSQDKSAGIIGSLFFIILFSVVPIIIGLNLKKKGKSLSKNMPETEA